MLLEIEPEPTADERDAIAAAVEEVALDGETLLGAWWEAGVAENLADAEPAVGPPGPEPAR